MLKNIILGIIVSLNCTLVFAGVDELDQDKANQALQGTVVMRIDQRTGTLSMAQVENVVTSKAEALVLAKGNFQAVPNEKIRSELDREAGASSWYWYYPGYSNGYGYNYGYNNAYYYYYGNCYNPWYSYSSGYYSYYYYNRYSYYYR